MAPKDPKIKEDAWKNGGYMCGLQFFFVHLLKLFEIEGVNMDGSFMPFKHPVVSKAVCIYHIYIYTVYTQQGNCAMCEPFSKCCWRIWAQWLQFAMPCLAVTYASYALCACLSESSMSKMWRWWEIPCPRQNQGNCLPTLSMSQNCQGNFAKISCWFQSSFMRPSEHFQCF